MPSSSKVMNEFLARVALDEDLSRLQAAATAFAKPRAGWIKTIRQALGISATVFARRLGVAPSTIVRIEANELAGTVNLDTLQRAADALDCQLVYALVPREKLSDTVQRQALKMARSEFGRTQQTMALEDQSVVSENVDKLVLRRAEELTRSRDLWRI